MKSIGVVGCGNISGIYLKNLTGVFRNVTVLACGDLDADKAREAAAKHGIPRILTFEEMLACPEIDIILNITTPGLHYGVSRRALEAGKSVYSEKPLAMTFAQGRELVELAREKGLYLGCAPDTFLGAGLSAAREAISAGMIGRPFAGAAFMMCSGHESWHPSPEFYYKKGGGPLFDMGPYYITALVELLGPVERVSAINSRTYSERIITSQPKYGQTVGVEVDTHCAALLHFADGATVTLVTSFDVCKHSMPEMELYGTLGSLRIPDPNGFGGPVLCASREEGEYRRLPLISAYSGNCRGLGLAEMALAMEERRRCFACGELGLHVLEVMEGIQRSSDERHEIAIGSRPPAPGSFDRTAPFGVLRVVK